MNHSTWTKRVKSVEDHSRFDFACGNGKLWHAVVLPLPVDPEAFFGNELWEQMTTIPVSSKRGIGGPGSSIKSGDPSKCSVCDNEGKMLVCAKCLREFYCSKECQRKDWKVHKQVCMVPDEYPCLGIEYRSREGRVLENVGSCVQGTFMISVERNCFGNCVTNQGYLETMAGVPLHLVAGSLGLCNPAPTWYEWGGMGETVYTTAAQFAACPLTGLPSVHFWLETEDGEVWDVLDRYLIRVVAKTWSKKIDTSDFALKRIVTGKSREVLKARGLEYVPAAPRIQKTLINNARANAF